MGSRNTLNVMVIALLSVLVLVLIFLLVLQNKALERAVTQRDTMEREKQEAKELSEKRDREARKLREVITGDEDPATTNVESIRDFLSQAVTYLQEEKLSGPAAGEMRPDANFINLIGKYQHTFATLREQVRNVQADLKEANERIKQREEEHSQQLTAKSTEVSNLTEDLSKKRNEVDDLTASKAAAEDRYSNQLTEKESDIADLQYRFEQQRRLWNQLEAKYETTIRKLKADKVPLRELADAEPHGHVQKVVNRHLAFIDLGLKDFVRPGMKFDVYRTRGKRRIKKGVVEITRVEDTFSYVNVLEEESEMDPIVKGDKIWSLYYKKGKAPRIAFAGNELSTPRINLELVKRKLTEEGIEVMEEVTVHTDYLIAIKGYKEDPRYEQAHLNGVMVLQESDILPYVLD